MRERNNRIYSYMSITFSGVGVISYFYINLRLAGIGIVIVGIIGAFYCLLKEQGARMEYERLVGELNRLGTMVPKCSKCGKQIPQGEVRFCPFCGTEVRS